MTREVTISACQYHVRPIRAFEDMAARVRGLLDQARGSDIVLFPELFTIELFTTLLDWKQRPISELFKTNVSALSVSGPFVRRSLGLCTIAAQQANPDGVTISASKCTCREKRM